MQLVVLLAACFMGEFMQTTVGFGLNLVVMAIASTFFPITTLASISSVLSLAPCIYFTVRWRKKVCLSALVWPLITMLSISALAIYTTQYIPVQTLKGFLGITFIALSIFFLAFQQRLHIRATRTGGLAVGVISGILSGYFSVGGPPVVAYLLSALDDKESYFATVQAMFLVSNLWTAVFRGINGYLNWEVLKLSALGYIFIAAGAFLGLKLLRHLNFEKMRTLAYIFIGLSGIWIAVNSWLL